MWISWWIYMIICGTKYLMSASDTNAKIVSVTRTIARDGKRRLRPMKTKVMQTVWEETDSDEVCWNEALFNPWPSLVVYWSSDSNLISTSSEWISVHMRSRIIIRSVPGSKIVSFLDALLWTISSIYQQSLTSVVDMTLLLVGLLLLSGTIVKSACNLCNSADI